MDVNPFTVLDTVTGEVDWRFGGERGLGAWDASSYGIFGGAGDGMVAAIDPDDGAERWRSRFPGKAEIVSAWRDRLVVADRAGIVVGFDGSTGAARWQHGSSEISDVNDIVVEKDRVYATYDERTAMASLDAENGTVRWHFAPGGELTKPVRTDGTVLVGSTNGYLYALTP